MITSTSGTARDEHPELGTAGDHLGQAQPGTLGRVQRHDHAAKDVADEQTDDRPQRVGAEDHRQRAVDDRGDLHVGPEPQCELAAWRAVSLRQPDLCRMMAGHRGHLIGDGYDPVECLLARNALMTTWIK